MRVSWLRVVLMVGCAIPVFGRSLDADEVRKCMESQAKSGKRDDAIRLLDSICDEDLPNITVNRGATPAIHLAAAVIGGERKKDGKLRAAVFGHVNLLRLYLDRPRR